MQCPKCENAELLVKKAKGGKLEIDCCERCFGVWFDESELEIILGNKAIVPYQIPSPNVEKPQCCCPKCGIPLFEFCYPGTIVAVDSCKRCHGIWLNYNEWKEIVQEQKTQDRMVCPRCHREQPKSEECSACGIIVAKFNKTHEPMGKSNQPHSSKESPENFKNETGRADSNPEMDDESNNMSPTPIPGIKGMLIRFINRSIENLTDN